MTSNARNRYSTVAAHYGLAVAASVLALVLSLMIDDPTKEPNTLLLFIGAVLITARFAGTGPGLVATLLTGVSIVYFYIPPVYSFGISRDVGILRLAEFLAMSMLVIVLTRSLNKAKHAAEQANRTKDTFLSMVSHELRQPLSAILGWSRILRSKKVDAETTDRALEVIDRNATLQQQLISD